MYFTKNWKIHTTKHISSTYKFYYRPLIRRMEAATVSVNTLSDGLRARLKTMYCGGKHLNDDSKGSENVLGKALQKYVIPYAKGIAEPRGYTIQYTKQISLYEMQVLLKTVCPDAPEPDPSNKNVCMKPDGGILWAVSPDGRKTPLLISEDKRQGTNDSRKAEGLIRQSTGNAIERGIKNMRAAEMICTESVFPYVLFGAGCDFHPTETIAKRLEAGNYGMRNHQMVLAPGKDVSGEFEEMVAAVDIRKRWGGKCITTICIKTHKWDEMLHNSSAWTEEEIAVICCKVVDQVFANIE